MQKAAADKQGLPALPLLLLWIWNETTDVFYRLAQDRIQFIYISEISAWDPFLPRLSLEPTVFAL